MNVDLEPALKLNHIMEDVRVEFYSAVSRFRPLLSPHEAFSVIREEFSKELWEEVCKSPRTQDPIKMRAEAIQAAAMCIRFIYDVIDNPPKVVVSQDSYTWIDNKLQDNTTYCGDNAP